MFVRIGHMHEHYNTTMYSQAKATLQTWTLVRPQCACWRYVSSGDCREKTIYHSVLVLLWLHLRIALGISATSVCFTIVSECVKQM